MKKNQFIKVTDVEQNLFEKLSGQKDKVLLLYTNELKEGEEEYLEYYFTYSDTTAENFGLETFYAKVKKTSKKNLTSNDLLSKAVSRLTEKMVKRNLDEPEVLEEPIISNQIYESSPKITSIEKTIIAAKDYSTSSQATYFFDCKGDGTSKGSFCCILEKGNEFFILTAGHNLQNKVGDGTTIKDIYGNFVQKGKKSPFYRLIKDTNNIVELELIEDYSNTYDAAILRINKCSGVDAKDFNKKEKDGKLKIETLDFYENAIKFENNYSKNYNNKYPDLDEKTDNGNTISVDSITIGYTGDKVYSSKFYKSNTASDKLYYYKPQLKNNDKSDTSGISGGCVFKNSNLRLLGGIHKGIGDYGKIPCSRFTPIDIFLTNDYKII